MLRSTYGLSPGLLVAIIVHAAIAPALLLTAPAVAAQYGGELGLSASQIGLLFSGELAAMSLATLPGYYWQKRWDWRIVGFTGAGLFIVANIASIFALNFSMLLALRFLSALGGGTLMVIGLASVVLSNQRDRVYGLWVCGQLVLGAVGLWVLPGLFAGFGLAALFVGLAFLMALTIPLIRCYPKNLKERPSNARFATGEINRRRAGLGIFALLAFYIGLSGVWTFIGSIAEASGITVESTGRLLAFATVLGIAGSLVAAAIGGRVPRSISLLLGYAGMIGSILLLLGTPQFLRFMLAAFVFKFVWTFVLPFILGAISDQDKDGRLMNTANLAVGGGLAIGPGIAGYFLDGNGGFSMMLGFSAVATALSFFAIIAMHIGHSRATHRTELAR